MDNIPNRHQMEIVKMAQVLLLQEQDRASITPALIADKINIVLSIMPMAREGLDHEAVTNELIRRFSMWIGKDTTLKNDEGHIPWLNAARKREWRYWQRYWEWLERSLSFTAVEALDRTTDSILSQLEDPVREGPWDRRGLVVGHVQSGKTGNYTGLICKAADAGYKIIIVLAGLHNNLRSQTQMRLDEGFLGYETKPVHDSISPIGVGEIDGDPSIRPNYATNRSDKGDFNTKIAQHLGISPEQRPWLFVVKKNKTVLTRLLKWVHKHVANSEDPESGKKIVTHLPLLLIDDEADNASVDTGAQIFDGEGNPDLEHEPKAINRLVRQLLHSFTRSAYVGYTATPFANIFIHESGRTSDEGPDLFPASFIINLAAPSNYIGPSRLFGLGNGSQRNKGLPLTRLVSDSTGEAGSSCWIPDKHKNGHRPLFNGKFCIPDSLAQAIGSFIIACAVRKLRNKGDEHSSMLIHVTRFNSVQQAVYSQIDEYVKGLNQRIRRGIDVQNIHSSLKTLWDKDFLPTNESIRANHPDIDAPVLPQWAQVLECLPEVLADVQVKMINGTAKDALDYADHKGTGLKVIAIGGDKLSRGLTLEGLCTSYFLRASKMYDTLMQMGRWFGYRPGYIDVCRLYTTEDLVEWFCHITDAAEELREEFDLMAESGGTPRDYGFKVQSHSVLMVTSQVKMRTAKSLMLSFSGSLLETVAMHRDPIILQRNLDAAVKLVSAMKEPVETNEITKNRFGKKQTWSGHLWQGVPAAEVVEFLRCYKTHQASYRVNGDLLAQFIESLNSDNELVSWTVAFIGAAGGAEIEIANGMKTKMLKRSPNANHTDRYSIGRLMSPRDESIDLDDDAWQAALEETRRAWQADPGRMQDRAEPDDPNGPAIRKIRGFGANGVAAHPERGLLILYVLDPEGANLPNGTPPVVAFGVSFPGSSSGRKVEYKVTNILWEQEYGSAE
ncbi:MAG: Z1 domain-containing protein [Deltaproteobacteria bacterium]|nr:Z1 domain-containing protein [Deltaproteobacteria bacterium]